MRGMEGKGIGGSKRRRRGRKEGVKTEGKFIFSCITSTLLAEGESGLTITLIP